VARIAPSAEARVFLQDQCPPQPELTPEQQEAFNHELERMLAELRRRPVVHEHRGEWAVSCALCTARIAHIFGAVARLYPPCRTKRSRALR
jgi:hypothetical protein